MVELVIPKVTERKEKEKKKNERAEEWMDR